MTPTDSDRLSRAARTSTPPTYETPKVAALRLCRFRQLRILSRAAEQESLPRYRDSSSGIDGSDRRAAGRVFAIHTTTRWTPLQRCRRSFHRKRDAQERALTRSTPLKHADAAKWKLFRRRIVRHRSCHTHWNTSTDANVVISSPPQVLAK